MKLISVEKNVSMKSKPNETASSVQQQQQQQLLRRL